MHFTVSNLEITVFLAFSYVLQKLFLHVCFFVERNFIFIIQQNLKTKKMSRDYLSLSRIQFKRMQI